MKLKYDEKKLNELACDYSIVAGGIRIRITDNNNNIIAASPYTRPEFCQKMLSCPCSEAKCKSSESHTAYSRIFNDVFTSTPCHAGIVEAVYPIVKDTKKIGYILFSSMRTRENIYDFASDLNYPIDDIDELNKIYQKIIYYDEERIECIGKVAAILAAYIMSDYVISVEYNTLIKDAMDYINNHLAGPLCVEDLCKEFNVSKSTLYNQFRLSLNCTVNDFISMRRLETAQNLLITKDESITGISEKIGFTDYTYFCKFFKKKTGLSPLQYRKKYR